MKKEYSIRSLNCIEEEIQDKKTVWKQYIRGKADIYVKLNNKYLLFPARKYKKGREQVQNKGIKDIVFINYFFFFILAIDVIAKGEAIFIYNYNICYPY